LTWKTQAHVIGFSGSGSSYGDTSADTEGEADIPIFIPVLFHELSSVQYHSIDEQLTELTALAVETIDRRIFLIRGEKVILSTDLAELYGVEPRALVQAVTRNIDRFPADFMFQLSREEWSALKSQPVILDVGRGKYPKYLPYALVIPCVVPHHCRIRCLVLCPKTFTT
jgi:hypothetical protein